MRASHRKPPGVSGELSERLTEQKLILDIACHKDVSAGCLQGQGAKNFRPSLSTSNLLKSPRVFIGMTFTA